MSEFETDAPHPDAATALADVRGFVAKTLDNIDPDFPWADAGWTGAGVRSLLETILTISEVEEPVAPEVIVMVIELEEDEEELVVVTRGVHTRWPETRGGHETDYYTDGELVVACPHGCGSVEFNEVDRSERWNRLRFETQPDRTRYTGEPNDLAGLPFAIISQGDGNYDTIGWMCEGCGGAVAIPEWVEVDWT